MKVFGPEPWGPALDEPGMYAGPLTSPDVRCLRCEETITRGDPGIVTSYLTEEGADLAAFHRECYLRGIVGSVGHQRGLCSCRGGPGTMDDPPGVSKREAARLAVKEWEGRMRIL